ncbi:hypothetical protein BDK51DRAFT_50900 [Blyttiomyces helicus]|uniref:Uncharacterized protein n=1 Tax=Blyttiomyces helicus TaxID=388810 RepID=A0A4P9W0T6_9FUNG|nr:hypothetical protein BDK51DRAFT_50900 [Blyttiomyces helicus]|eukprot:RKO84170.1 hypothetical protein BDK51DRAFT_50900 [Blyttiomyces helicus]
MASNSTASTPATTATFSPFNEIMHAATRPREKLSILHDGIKSPPIAHQDSHPSLDTVQAIVEQAQIDPCPTTPLIKHWIGIVEAEIEHARNRLESARVFGSLLTEWLPSESGPATTDVDAGAGEERNERLEKQEQRRRMQDMFFTPADVDTGRLCEYLDELFTFDEPEHKNVLESVRWSMKSFGNNLLNAKWNRAIYKAAKEQYDARYGTESDAGRVIGDVIPTGGRVPFMEYDEFIKARVVSTRHSHWYNAYTHLLLKVELEAPQPSVEVSTALGKLPHSDSSSIGRWQSMSDYWKSIVAIYGGEALARYGELAIMDAGLIPLGMISSLKSVKIKWDQ